MQTVLISGGNDGLGKALAADLVSTHTVIILAHHKEKTEAAAKEIGCDYVVADVTDPTSLATAVEEVLEKHKKIDVLVNNAGIWIQGSLETNDPERIKETIEANTTGTILLTRFVLPHMKAAKSGRIINVISQAGLNVKKERTVYNASKWAVTGFTKALQDELTGAGVTVTGFYPGPMKTALFSKAGVEKDLSRAMKLEDVVRAVRFIIESPSDIEIPEFGMKPASY